MGDIVDFSGKPETEKVYSFRCDCGCLTFYALSTGEVECAKCGTVAEDGTGFLWKVPVSEARAEEGDDPPPHRDVNYGEGGEQQALDSVLQFAKWKGTAAVLVLRKDGRIWAWGQHEFKGLDADWLYRNMRAGIDVLLEREE